MNKRQNYSLNQIKRKLFAQGGKALTYQEVTDISNLIEAVIDNDREKMVDNSIYHTIYLKI